MQGLWSNTEIPFALCMQVATGVQLPHAWPPCVAVIACLALAAHGVARHTLLRAAPPPPGACFRDGGAMHLFVVMATCGGARV